jgi:hypothetical protein
MSDMNSLCCFRTCFFETWVTEGIGLVVMFYTHFRECLGSNSGGDTGYLDSEAYRGFPRFMKANAGIRSPHDCFLPNRFQSIWHLTIRSYIS